MGLLIMAAMVFALLWPWDHEPPLTGLRCEICRRTFEEHNDHDLFTCASSLAKLDQQA